MILKILSTTDNVETLRKVSNPVDLNTLPMMQNFIHDLRQTMFANNGAGISAIQVGMPLQLFIVEYQHEHQVVINPKILSSSNYRTEAKESCLSIPNYSVKVRRPQSLVCDYYDEKGVEHRGELWTGMKARIFQHEWDHCLGILINMK